jgi:hypothetical protein
VAFTIVEYGVIIEYVWYGIVVEYGWYNEALVIIGETFIMDIGYGFPIPVGYDGDGWGLFLFGVAIRAGIKQQ